MRGNKFKFPKKVAGESKVFGLCPKCGKLKWLTGHHIFPKRFFGNGDRNNVYLFVCLDCHQELEEILPDSTPLSREMYYQITRKFIRDENIMVRV